MTKLRQTRVEVEKHLFKKEKERKNKDMEGVVACRET